MLCFGNSDDNDSRDSSEARPKLNIKNYLNVVFYAINTLVTFLIGTFGVTGAPTNTELSEKYQTIITPKGSAFSIWGVIFIFQAIFVLVQLLPSFRARPLVQDGVSYYYVAACTFQAAWTFAFAYEVIPLSVIFLISICLSLVGLLYAQYDIPASDDSTKTSLTEFWLLRFPFMIHCGWVTCASVLNINVQAVASGAPADVQLTFAIVSLAVLHAVSVWVVFGLRASNPNHFTIAGVIAWASGWIYSELQNPSTDVIVELLDPTTISGVSYAALAVAVIVTLQVVVRVLMMIVQNCFFSKTQSNSSSTDAKGEQP